MPPKLKRRTIHRVWVYFPGPGGEEEPSRGKKPGRYLRGSFEYSRKKPPRNPLPEHYQGKEVIPMPKKKKGGKKGC